MGDIIKNIEIKLQKLRYNIAQNQSFAQFGIGVQMKRPVCIATTGLYMLIRPII